MNLHHLTIPVHRHIWKCFRPDGSLKWQESFDNLVMITGKNWYLQQGLVSAVTPLWYIGVVGTTSWTTGFLVGDTMPSHSGWVESISYSNPTRPQWVPGVVVDGTVSNVVSKASFTISIADALRSGFMVNDSIKGGSIGTILGGGDFSIIRGVTPGDTLNCTVYAIQL